MRKILFASLMSVLMGLSATVPSHSSSGNGMPEWVENAVIYEINVRQYSNDSSLDSVTSDLPRLKDLGVNVLWLMPIYPISEMGRLGSLGSYYAVKDYLSVNPEFGTDQDLTEFVTAAHQQGFKVILDWVANHTGWDHPWIAQHPEWYVHENEDPNSPIVSPNGWNDVAQLNYQNSYLRATMIDAMKHWVTGFDIDGYRCDFASGVPVDFWSEASAQLNAIKPLFMLAEAEGVPGHLNGPFDSEYAWTFKDKFNALANLGMGVAGLDYLVTERLNSHPQDTAAMLFITNHDENSWNGTEYQRLEKNVSVMTVLYFTLPGIPLVYNGQEISMNHALAFFDKDPIDWSQGKDNIVLQKMIELKRNSPALAVGMNRGEYQRINVGNSSVLVFLRTASDEKVLVVANVSAAAQPITINLGANASAFREVLTNVLTTLPSQYRLTVPAHGYRVLTTNLAGGINAPVKSIKLSVSKLSLKVGKTRAITTKLSPTFPSDPRVRWSSSKRTVATVSSAGVITAKKRGTATIYARTSNPRVFAKVLVTVK